MYINGIKYACSTCIKGHRSSHCNHVDRPLFEIRKKGRPVTQCTYCRDLRKTKQVHIKCACNSKKGDHQQQQQPILIYRNTSSTCSVHSNDEIIQDHPKQHCTCPSLNNGTPMIRSSSGGGQAYLSSNVPQDSVDVVPGSLMSAPLCTTPLVVKEETPSYSWALVTSPSANHIDLPHASSSSSSCSASTSKLAEDDNNNHHNLHLGFIFHKPSNTSRILDGQPRVRRRRSTKKSSSSTPTRPLTSNVNYDTLINVDTLTGLSTPPPSSTVSSSEPMDVQFDYLTQQLEILSSHENQQQQQQQQQQDLAGGFANAEELTAILNNVLQKDNGLTVDSMFQENQILSTVPNPLSPLPPLPPTTHISSGLVQPQQQQHSPVNTPNINRSHCGSFVPSSSCRKPVGSSGGESVVITITPLVTPNKEDQQQQRQEYYPTTTRIVTCYCGSRCTCPGCLVHPGNFFLGSDPYSGPLINPSSSASSSCYGSDDEDIASIYSNHNNTNFTF